MLFILSPIGGGVGGSIFTFLNRVLADLVASGARISGSDLIFKPTSSRLVMFESQQVLDADEDNGGGGFFIFTAIVSSSVTYCSMKPTFLHTKYASRRDNRSDSTINVRNCMMNGKNSFRKPSSADLLRIRSSSSSAHCKNS